MTAKEIIDILSKVPPQAQVICVDVFDVAEGTIQNIYTDRAEDGGNVVIEASFN